LKESLEILDKTVYRFINERRALMAESEDGLDPTGDLLSMLMNVRYEDTGEGMDDKQLRDEVMTMFLAGHETTANTLVWAYYALSQHPDVEVKMLSELDHVLEGRRPTFEDLSELPYTRMVIDESLRRYPPIWMTGRTALEDDIIDGYHIPKDSMLMICFYLLHTNPEYWDDPLVFRPERFSPEESTGRPRNIYYPFGHGPRRCIGEHFALMEAQLAMALIGQNYRLRLAPGEVVELSPKGTLQPKQGPLMVLEHR
jgi:cytochrome P450